MPTPQAKTPVKLVAIPTGGLHKVPLNQLVARPGNPRGKIDKEKLAELGASIKAAGILENLIVRRAKKNGHYEVIAGARRLAAAKALAKAGAVRADMPVPVNIVDVDDAGALRLALIENVQRVDIDPVDEGEGYATLLAGGDTTETLARATGKSLRHVQSRVELARKLAPKAKAALRDGAISVVQARAMLPGDAASQQAIVKQIARGGRWTEADVKREVFAGLPEVPWAIFDLDRYKGEIVADPDAKDPAKAKRFFRDAGQAKTLQLAAIDALVNKKRADKTVAFVAVYDHRKGQYADLYYDHPKVAKGGGTVIEIGRDLAVEVHDNRRKSRPTPKDRGASGTGGKGKKSPAEPCTKAHAFHARRRKTHALQIAVAGDLKAGKIVAILALMDGDGILAKTTYASSDDATPADALVKLLDGWRPKFAGLLKATGDAWAGESKWAPMQLRGDAATAKAWSILWKMVPAELDRLLAQLAARLVGSWCEHYGTQLLGDKPLPLAIARDLGLKGRESRCDLTRMPADLHGLSSPVLAAIARATGAKAAKTQAATRQAIVVATQGAGYVVPSLRFGAPAEIKAALKAAPAKAMAKKKAKAPAKAKPKAKRKPIRKARR